MMLTNFIHLKLSMKFEVIITMAIFNIFAHLSNQYGLSGLDLMVKLLNKVDPISHNKNMHPHHAQL